MGVEVSAEMESVKDSGLEEDEDEDEREGVAGELRKLEEATAGEAAVMSGERILSRSTRGRWALRGVPSPVPSCAIQ